MKNFLTVSLVTALLIGASLASAAQPAPLARSASMNDGTALERPNALSVEILGRAGVYSINYDHSLSDEFGVGIGLSAYSLSATSNSTSTSVSIVVLPIYGNFYFQPGPSRGFLSAGFDVVTGSGNVSGNTFGGTGAVPVIGGGYEYRGYGGFLFRAAPYLLIGNGNVAITVGLSFGYAF